MKSWHVFTKVGRNSRLFSREKPKKKKKVPIPIRWPWAKHGTKVYFTVCPKFSVKGMQYKAVRHGCSIAGIFYALGFGGAACLVKYGELWETTKTIPLGKIWFPPHTSDETKSSRIMVPYGSALQINQLQSMKVINFYMLFFEKGTFPTRKKIRGKRRHYICNMNIQHSYCTMKQ